MSRRRRTNIPVPRPDLRSLTDTAVAVKQHIEAMDRGDDAYVSVKDLLTLGVIVISETGTQRQITQGDLAKLALLERST